MPRLNFDLMENFEAKNCHESLTQDQCLHRVQTDIFVDNREMKIIKGECSHMQNTFCSPFGTTKAVITKYNHSCFIP